VKISVRTSCLPLLAIAMIACVVAGCAGEKCQNALTISFQFKDARGITVGDRVMGDGIVVGQVAAPPHSPSPGVVLIQVKIDNIDPEKRDYLTKGLSAEIKKDGLVVGEGYINLLFPDKPGMVVPDGVILKGKDVKEIVPGVTMLSPSSQEIVQIMKDAFGVSDPAEAGQIPYIINWGCVAVLALLSFVMVLDLLLRLPQGKDRRRSSPRIFRAVWYLFVICLFFKVVLFTVQALMLYGLMPFGNSGWITVPGTIYQLLAEHTGFWVLAFFIIVVCFKMQLLMKVKAAR